jgi:hypothetical protein
MSDGMADKGGHEPIGIDPVVCLDCVANPTGGVLLCLTHAVGREALLEVQRLLTVYLDKVLDPMERATPRGDLIRAALDTVRAGLGRTVAP